MSEVAAELPFPVIENIADAVSLIGDCRPECDIPRISGNVLAAAKVTVHAQQSVFTLRQKLRCCSSNQSFMNRFNIKLGSTESFLFATSDGVNWMHGPDKVKFRDRGDSGIFKWDDFQLEVHED